MRKIYLCMIVILFTFAGNTLHISNAVPKYVIAVLDFKDATGNADYKYLRVAVPEIFATNLAQTSDITILERDRVKKILKEAGLVMAGVTEGDEKKIGKLLAAKQLLSGTIVKTGDKFRIDARLTDVDTGKILSADKRRCETVDEIIDAVDSLSEIIVKKITGKDINFSKDIEVASPGIIKGNFVDFEVLKQNKYYLTGSNEAFSFRAGFYAKKVEKKKKRVPLNLSIVLDRSGSMSDSGKLDYAKEAIRFIIKNLNSSDMVSMVAYDDSVDVVFTPMKAADKEKIISMIDKLQPGGSTNLSGGLLEGFNQVKSNINTGQINRILLISDGLANVGITDPVRIQQLVKQNTKQGITVSSFGVGQYFNEKLLTGIAEYGSANYYYIDKSDKIPDIFSRELEGLLTVVAQNCILTFELMKGVELKEVYGYKYFIKDNTVNVKMGDIVSEEKKLALVKLSSLKGEKGERAVARVIFTYDDAVGDKGRVKKEDTLKVVFTKDKKLVNNNFNPIIVKDAEMFKSSELMEKTMDLVDKGDMDEARKVITNNLNIVRRGITRYKSREMKKQAINIIEYQTNLERVSEMAAEEKSDSFQMMQKGSRSKQYMLRKKK